MSMKRCFELSISSSVAVAGRALLVGSVLSFATACAKHDAVKTDSTVASADSATSATTTAATATPATAVESISTGETALASDSSKAASAGVANVAAPVAKPAAAPVAAQKPVHHAAATHTAAATTAGAPAAAAATPAAPAAAPAATTVAKADTGEKAGADTSKKAAGADKLLVDSATYEGWKIFASNCYRCHGEDAMGGTFAPNLRHSLGPDGSITHDLFLVTVTNGRPAKGMPAWGGTYNKEQFEQIYKYLIARSNGSLAPGRPHRAQDLKPRSTS